MAQKRTDASDPSKAEYAFYQNDHLGTPQILVAKNGAIVWQAEYDVFGETAELLASWQNPLRFPGQYLDQETNLHYNWNRYYNPSLGRYITSDPIGLDGGMNRFGYVEGNPVFYFDYNGLNVAASMFAGGEAMLGFGGGVSVVTCCDENRKRKEMIFTKECFGPSINIGFSVGRISGMDGAQCKPDSYTGWFGELNLGPASIDIGLKGGKKTPKAEGSGTFEGGVRWGSGSLLV